MSQEVTRKRLEIFKYTLYVAFPLVFGYGLGRLPQFWEKSAELFPSAAANPKGPYLPKELTEHRPSLHTEFQKLRLEQALDAALEDVRSKKAAAAALQKPV